MGRSGAKKGEVVDTLTTGKDGKAKSKELYLGKYEVKEVTAPRGMVLNGEIHMVELAYDGGQPTGHGTVLVDAWNGAPALYLGAQTNVVI